jgi:heme A synthase
MELFSDLSIWTMVHGMALGGGAMVALFGALLLIYVGATESEGKGSGSSTPSPLVGLFSVASAGLLWITVLVGTYVVFPPYRAAPPEGATDLSTYPRSMVLADPSTAWLHSFGMEIKEHVPWIAAMLATAVAFVVVRFGGHLTRDPSVRRTVLGWLAISLLLVSAVALLGVLVNKVAPVQ